MLRARYILDLDNATNAFESVKPELTTFFDNTRRALVEISKNGQSLIITVNAQDVTACRAASNTWLRLVLVAMEIETILKKKQLNSNKRKD